MRATWPQSAGVVRAATFGVVVALTSLVSSSAGAKPIIPVISTPVIIDASSAGALSLVSLSCVSAGNCTAVGSLANSSTSTYAPVAVSETAGTWGAPVSITLPAGAYAGGSLTGLTSIQCFSAGNCVAVGRFVNSPVGYTSAMAVSETGGVWGVASSVGQPTNGSSPESSWLTSLSCTSAGSCSAVGTYFDSQGRAAPMVVAEVNGSWGVPSELPVASGSTPVQGLWSISCVTTTCTAAGPIANGANDVAGVASESGGVWSSASPVSTTPGTVIYGISCTTTGCVAVGAETSSTNSIPTLFIEQGGIWNLQTVQVSTVSSDDDLLWSVDCTSWGNCVSMGDVSTGTGVFALAEEGGTWLPALDIPVNDASATIVEATGLSCTSALTCAAVGAIGSNEEANAVAWTSHVATPTRTIVCRRGHQVRHVSGAAPRCPSGFHQS